MTVQLPNIRPRLPEHRMDIFKRWLIEQLPPELVTETLIQRKDQLDNQITRYFYHRSPMSEHGTRHLDPELIAMYPIEFPVQYAFDDSKRIEFIMECSIEHPHHLDMFEIMDLYSN